MWCAGPLPATIGNDLHAPAMVDLEPEMARTGQRKETDAFIQMCKQWQNPNLHALRRICCVNLYWVIKFAASLM